MSRDASYTKKYAKRRQKKSKVIDFYLDDDFELLIYKHLSNKKNVKQYIIDLIKKDMGYK